MSVSPDNTPPSYDMWGPTGTNHADGVAARPPRRIRPWGLIDVVWFVLFLLASQTVVVVILGFVAIAQNGVEVDSITVAEDLTKDIADLALTGPGLALSVLSQWVAFLAAPIYASYRKGHRSLAKDFGLYFRRVDLVLGVGLAVVLQVVMGAISWALNQTDLDLSGADNTSMVTDKGGAVLVLMVFAAVIMAPLTEELLFRGLLLRAFLRSPGRLDLAPHLPGVTDRFHGPEKRPVNKVGVVMAVLLSSAFFGLMHAQPVETASGGYSFSLGSWVLVAQTGLLGLVFALVALKTKRIGTTITAHLVFNATSLSLVFLLAK